jgi:hypothetical protein
MVNSIAIKQLKKIGAPFSVYWAWHLDVSLHSNLFLLAKNEEKLFLHRGIWLRVN